MLTTKDLFTLQPVDSDAVKYYRDNRYATEKVAEFTQVMFTALDELRETPDDKKAAALVHNITLFCADDYFEDFFINFCLYVRKHSSSTVAKAIAYNNTALRMTIKIYRERPSMAWGSAT